MASFHAVLFDFDGTLTTPGHLDFLAIRNAIGCPIDTSILDYIDGIESERERDRARAILDEFEMSAAALVSGASGLQLLFEYLRERRLQCGILTRNSMQAVEASMRNIHEITFDDFECIITRDDDLPVKPAPEGVHAAVGIFREKPENVVVVGDYIYDIEAGNRAGVSTVFVDNLTDRKFAAPEADFSVADLRSLIPILHANK